MGVRCRHVGCLLALACAATACGRFSFDHLPPSTFGDDATAGDADGDSDGDSSITMAVCGDSDGVCPPACPTGDADCVNVCGDGKCVGNAGELCATCMTDCAIATGCGNGACEADEDGVSCYADCGPVPWMWSSEEQMFETEVNNRRVAGVQCPGDASPRFAPALAVGPMMLRLGAREYAWEMAHQDYYPLTSIACNGRTYSERQAPFGGNGGGSYRAVGTAPTFTAILDSWATNNTMCPIMMSTTAARFAAGIAHDATIHAYVLWLQNP